MSKAQILEAARQLEPKRLQTLLATRPDLIRAVDRNGSSLLQIACAASSKELGVSDARAIAVVAMLFDHGVDVESGFVTREGHYVNSVWFAIRGGNLKLVRFLLERGARPCGLFSAGWRENLSALGVLLDAGAEIDEVIDDETPFLHCWKNARFRSAKFLVGRGANPNFQDSKGRSALHHGLDKAYDPTLLKFLLRAGASPDLRDGKGRSPRELASRKRDQRYRTLIAA